MTLSLKRTIWARCCRDAIAQRSLRLPSGDESLLEGKMTWFSAQFCRQRAREVVEERHFHLKRAREVVEALFFHLSPPLLRLPMSNTMPTHLVRPFV